MNKLMKALGFKEPKPRETRLGLSLRGGGYASLVGKSEWIKPLIERIDSREESWIETGQIIGFTGTRTIDNSYWIPDIVSYWVDWGDE